MVTMAEQCLIREDPYEEAVKFAAYKGMPNAFRKVFHFEDGSYLAFEIAYKPAEAGRSFPCPLK